MDNSKNNEHVDFGDVLRYYRKKARLSQEQLAEDVCTREYIVQIEKGGKIPTLYIVNALSRKMGINLYDAYAIIIDHNDFDTHNKIEELNEAIAAHDEKLLYHLALDYSSLPGFSCGIPLQCIKHAFAVYCSNVLHDHEKAVAYSTEGLAVSELNNPEAPPVSTLTNLDACLLTTKSVGLCRMGNLVEGRKYFKFLHACTKLRITQSRYIANRNRRFDLNMFALTAFNICEFFPDSIEENLSLLSESINLLNEYKCTYMQSELLLYKARYLYDTGRSSDARDHFNAGYYLLICNASTKKADKRASGILEDRFSILKD